MLSKRGIPTYSVSSIFRPNQIFFRWYGHHYRRVLKCFTKFFVQNETSRALLATLGITDVAVTGDTRFDRVLAIKAQAKELPVVDAFKQGRKVFVAGSSWQPDEDIFIRFFNTHKDWKLIIAPHVIGEDHLMQILSGLERKAVRYTQTTPEEARDADCLIIDCFGLLSSIYRMVRYRMSEAVSVSVYTMFSRLPCGAFRLSSDLTTAVFRRRRNCWHRVAA